MRRGLIVGKFMPLHRGHQLLIETALSEVDDLTIVVYDSHPEGDYTPMPIEKRLSWLTQLYPQAENILPRRDPLDGVQEFGKDFPYDPYIDKDDPAMAPVYAKDLEFLGKFDYVFSSEEYGEPFAKALGATNRVVDVARNMLPISGTQIRENVYEHRGWVDPIVYRSLIQKVVFVGTESTGKSTIARRMAQELNTKWVHEYGRELWEKQGLQGTFHDMYKIALNHYAREQAGMLHSRDFLFCDTNPWTTLQWSLMYCGTADARLSELVDKTMKDYIWVLCANDFGWVQDGVRELDGKKSQHLQDQIMDSLEAYDIAPYRLWGSVDHRVEQMMELLDRPLNRVLELQHGSHS